MREVRVDAFVSDLAAVFAMQREPSGRVLVVGSEAERLEAAESMSKARRGRGARQLSDPAFLERVAEVYRAHLDGNPQQAVADAFFVGTRQAGNYIARAREAEKLPPTTRGRKAG